MDNLEKRIEAIENRNKKVEADKAWEVSFARRVLIAFSTYLVIGLFMFSLGISDPFKNAIIPTFGFILSTLSLPFLKDFWIKYFYKKD